MPSASPYADVPTADVVKTLRRAVRGVVLTPDDERYDGARRVFNGRIDRYPKVIVRCTGVADVLAVVRLARETGLPLAIRGAGHSGAGFGVCDNGVVIDLSALTGVRVDPAQRTVWTRAGTTWGEFDHETQAFGLATTGARISTTGIAGVTLGGGYGWLMRRHGLAVDNLLSVDLVTADGQLLTVSESAHRDLFWAVRGGGGNFGVITALEYQLHTVGPIIMGGAAFYSIERIREILEWYRAYMTTAPDELSALCNVLCAPPAPFVPPNVRGVPVVAVAVCHLGSLATAERDLLPLRDLGPLAASIRPMRYTQLQRMYDPAGEFGWHVYGRSGHLPALTDEVLTVLAAHAPRITSPQSIVMISQLGGAVSRVCEHDTAFGYRNTAFDVSVTAIWGESEESERHIRWASSLWEAVRPFCRGVYVNELGEDGTERLTEAYRPETLARLAAVKAIYDPNNLFKLNHNIRPVG